MNVPAGKKVVEKKDERTLAKEAQLKALLEAKKKKKEEEMKQAQNPEAKQKEEDKQVRNTHQSSL